MHYQVTLKNNLLNKWAEFNPASQCIAAVKQIEWNCIHHGGNYYVLLFLLAETEIFAIIIVALSKTNKKFLHSQQGISFKFFMF